MLSTTAEFNFAYTIFSGLDKQKKKKNKESQQRKTVIGNHLGVKMVGFFVCLHTLLRWMLQMRGEVRVDDQYVLLCE